MRAPYKSLEVEVEKAMVVFVKRKIESHWDTPEGKETRRSSVFCSLQSRGGMGP
jgi:hypothetical protein